MRLWRYCIAGLLFDWVLYVVWCVIPLYATDLGAGPRDLGLLQACSSLVYVAMSVVMGCVADRVSRPLLVRLGCVLMVVACLLVPRAGSLWTLLAIVPVVGLSGTFFWPSVQGAIGAEARPDMLERDIGLFNVLWSIGKSVGFLTGAALKGGLGVPHALLAAAAGAAAITLFYPLRDLHGTAGRLADRADPGLRPAFLRMSWVMNFVAFGVGATIANQYILFCRAHAIGLGVGKDPVETFFGVILFGAFAWQTATFAAARFWRGWTYRRAPLYAAQILMAAGAALLAHVTDARWLLLCTPLLGIGLGFGYVASLYYSLHATEEHGKYSGLHEAILGSGNFAMPLAAGALAGGLGDLRWPYWLCALSALAAIAVEEVIYRTMRRSSSKRSIL